MAKSPRRQPHSRRQRGPGRPQTRSAMRWTGALLGVFTLGVALGALGGWGLGLFDTTQQPPAPTAEAPSAIEPEEGEALYQLPVTVRQSERARDAYLKAYEENLAAAPPAPTLPDATSPLPDPAPSAAPLEEQTEGQTDGRAAAQRTAPVEDAPVDDAPPPAASDPPPQAARPAPSIAPKTAPRTWLARAQPATLDPDRPILAVVIDDAGVDVVRSRRAVRLPGPLTIAFLPYGYDLPAMVQTAQTNGHEIMVHLPMEPTSPDADPGPEALLTGLSAEELDRRIDWNLARFGHYVGLNNHMGSKFTADRDGMRRVLTRLAADGLFFLDSVTTAETQGYRLAQELGVPYAVRDVFIDHSLEPAAIRGQLAEAVATAERQGYAVAIGHPHDETLEALADWLPRIEAEAGVQLVPLSAVIRRRYGEG